MKLNAGEFYHGDYLVESLKIKDESVDLVLTDPPYGLIAPIRSVSCGVASKAVEWDDEIDVGLMLKNISRILKPSGRAVIFGGGKTSVDLLSFYGRSVHKLRFTQRAAWIKTQGGFFLKCKKALVGCFEDIFIFTKVGGKPIFNLHGKKCKKNTFVYPSGARGIHPTKKPTPLLEDLIKTYSNEGNLVADFFSGSGSTGVACENTGRSYVLIERDPMFYERGQLRCQAAADEAFQELKF
jgi:site-specific DNA-methyltransferase (adenine-specific)